METPKFFSANNIETEQERSFHVPIGHDLLFVSLKGQTWTSILSKDRQISKELGSHPVVGFSVPSGTVVVKTNGTIEKIESKISSQVSMKNDKKANSSACCLQLSSNAPDEHIVDGIGELPADGNSFCTITIEKIAFDGTPVTEENHQDELYLRTTGGLIKDETGQQHIRSLNLKAGRAAFRLVSEPNPKVVTVSVLSKDPMLANAEIQIEFV